LHINIQQVYLLMLIDRTMLPYAKSTISCTLSIIIRQWALVDSKLPNKPINIGY